MFATVTWGVSSAAPYAYGFKTILLLADSCILHRRPLEGKKLDVGPWRLKPAAAAGHPKKNEGKKGPGPGPPASGHSGPPGPRLSERPRSMGRTRLEGTPHSPSSLAAGHDDPHPSSHLDARWFLFCLFHLHSAATHKWAAGVDDASE